MYQVRILFKSGNTLELRVKKFNTKYNGDELTGLEWEATDTRIMFVSLKDVEAVTLKRIKLFGIF